MHTSVTDTPVVDEVSSTLDRFGIASTTSRISALRAPHRFREWVGDLELRGIQVVIAVAGTGAGLAGSVAALTTLPVIGLPLRGGAVDGLEALLAMTQLPPGVPVASVGLDNARNAAVLAVQILAVADPDLAIQLQRYKQELEDVAAERV